MANKWQAQDSLPGGSHSLLIQTFNHDGVDVRVHAYTCTHTHARARDLPGWQGHKQRHVEVSGGLHPEQAVKALGQEGLGGQALRRMCEGQAAVRRMKWH